MLFAPYVRGGSWDATIATPPTKSAITTFVAVFM